MEAYQKLNQQFPSQTQNNIILNDSTEENKNGRPDTSELLQELSK